MGLIGLTEAQEKKRMELFTRSINGPALTSNMEKELSDLTHKKVNPELSQTCKTYLHEWYANDNEEIFSKYFEKGVMMEYDAINFMSDVLNLGIAEKNLVRLDDEYFTGECDVDCPQLDAVIDIKCPWGNKTLHDSIHELDADYEWQGRGYMHLWKRKNFILFYALMDTPEDANFGKEVSFSHLTDDKRWVAYQIKHDQSKIDAIIERVKLCRIYLEWYDKFVKSKLGKITIL